MRERGFMTTVEVINDNIPLIRHIAKKFYNVSEEDLMQVGTIGLLKALKNFREGSVKFSTYAYDYIFGEMYDYVNKERKIKLSKEYLKLAKKIAIARDAIKEKTGIIPTYQEIAEFLKVDYCLVVSVMEVSRDVVSLDEQNKDGTCIYDLIKDKEIDLNRKMDIERGIMNLPLEEQEIIKYRYYYDLTQQEVADILGLSQVSVSRKESKCLQRLKEYVE